MTNTEQFVANVLASAGVETESGPITASFADERIAEKIARFSEPKQREGLQALDKSLRDRDVPPGVRLHLVSAVVHLSLIAGESLEDRRGRVARK